MNCIDRDNTIYVGFRLEHQDRIGPFTSSLRGPGEEQREEKER